MATLPIGADMTIATASPQDETVASSATKTASGWDIAIDVSVTGIATFTANLYAGGTLVGSSTGLAVSAALSMEVLGSYSCGGDAVDTGGGELADTWIQRFIREAPVMMVLTGSGLPVSGDLLELIPESPTITYDTATFTRICMTDIPTVTFTDCSLQSGCCLSPMRGNVDYDDGDAVNIADLTTLVAYLFGGSSLSTCWDGGNVDGDMEDKINIADLTHLVAYLFGGGPAPADCP